MRDMTPTAKLRATVIEIRALFDILNEQTEALEARSGDAATWAQLGTASHIREQLVELAAGLEIRSNGSEFEARGRVLAAIALRTSK